MGLYRTWQGGRAEPGSAIVRAALPVAVALPLLCGGLQWASQRAGYFNGGAAPLALGALQAAALAGLLALLVRRLRRQEKERQTIDRQAEEIHQRYRQLFQSSPLALCISTPQEGLILDANLSFLRLMGLHRDQVVGRTQSELEVWVSPEDREQIARELTSATGHTPVTRESAFRMATGEIRHLLATVDRVELNQTPCLLWVFNDMTKLRHHEEKIRDLVQLLNEAQDAICVRDMEDRIRYWNTGAERLFGWNVEDVLGQPLGERLQVDPQVSDEARQSTLRTGRWQGEVALRHQNGQLILVNSRWTLALDAEGRPKSILTIYTDITERKQFEARLLRAQRLESIGTLAGGIAHDLNNVLAPILMAVQCLGEIATDEDARTMIDILEKSAQRGARIIKQLLTFSRGLEAQRVVLQPKHLLKEMLQLIQETFSKSITVTVDCSDSLWTVHGDVTQLHQVLMNLCVNARDAMPGPGRITLSAENVALDAAFAQTHPEGRPGRYVAITVSDTGQGIPREHLEKIFDPFFTTKEVGKGTGLGLSVALGIVKSHGGFLQVESEPGKGSSFRVYLPAAESDAPAPQVAASPGLPRGQGELVLLVDDEEAIRNIARQTLEKYGYRVLLAADGTEALSQYRQHPGEVQVVLTDMMMPRMDGRATARALLKLDPRLKVVGLSGLIDDHSDPEATPVAAHLTKPFTAEQLLRALGRVLGRE